MGKTSSSCQDTSASAESEHFSSSHLYDACHLRIENQRLQEENCRLRQDGASLLRTNDELQQALCSHVQSVQTAPLERYGDAVSDTVSSIPATESAPSIRTGVDAKPV